MIRSIQLAGDGDGPQEERFGHHQLGNVDKPHCLFLSAKDLRMRRLILSLFWVRGANSGLDKRQCTVQLTIFADGVARVKPYIIFRGKGKRISFKEQLQYDKRATVRFQENAWCDGPAMEYWANNCWKPYVKDEYWIYIRLKNQSASQES